MNVAVLMLHGSGFLITPLAPWHFTMLVDVGLRLDGGMTYTDDWLIDIFITFQELKHTLPYLFLLANLHKQQTNVKRSSATHLNSFHT